MKSNRKRYNKELAGMTASYLFEAFAKDWVEKALLDRKELVRIRVLALTTIYYKIMGI